VCVCVCVESRCCFLLSKEWGGVGLLPVFIQQLGAAITERQNCGDNRIGTHESVAGTTQVRRRISLKSAFPFVISPACHRLCGSMRALRLLGAGKRLSVVFFSPLFSFSFFFIGYEYIYAFPCRSAPPPPPGPPLWHTPSWNCRVMPDGWGIAPFKN